MQETVKILMLGEGGVGKSSLLFRYVDEKFTETLQATLGVEFKQKRIKNGHKEILVQVWDTAGQERFKTITPIYYKNVQGVCLVYSVMDKSSFQQVTNWIENLKEHVDYTQLSMVLVGNKADMGSRAVSQEEGQIIANNLGIQYYECSAKTGINVKEMFQNVVNQVLVKKVEPKASGMKLNQQKEETEKKCCD